MISRNKISGGLLKDSKYYALNERIEESNTFRKELNLKEIIGVDFPPSQYYRQQTKKNQIVLHHTVSGIGSLSDVNWWKSRSSRIGTAIIIGRDGRIYQCFSSKFFAYHLGLHTSNNKTLNKGSIGIEIDSWGGLVKSNKGNWHPAKWDKNKKKFVPNLRVKAIKNVIEFPNGFRGFKAFEKYTSKQIESVRELLVYWNKKYDIPLNYNSTMWDISKDALNGKSGVWTHVSYRKDKSDCYPDTRLIKMLKSLTK